MSVSAQKSAKWATSATYPLSKAIWKATSAKAVKKDPSRADIVSPKLCGEFNPSYYTSIALALELTMTR